MGKSSSLKSTIAVSLNNYLDAGAIVAGASGITLWQNYLGLSEMHLGWLNAISANALGAAIGAIIGGFLADVAVRFPRHRHQRGRRRAGIVDIYLGEF